MDPNIEKDVSDEDVDTCGCDDDDDGGGGGGRIGLRLRFRPLAVGGTRIGDKELANCWPVNLNLRGGSRWGSVEKPRELISVGYLSEPRLSTLDTVPSNFPESIVLSSLDLDWDLDLDLGSEFEFEFEFLLEKIGTALSKELSKLVVVVETRISVPGSVVVVVVVVLVVTAIAVTEWK